MLDEYRDIYENAAISVAITPHLHEGRLPPELWEKLRLRLQSMYRLATGEEFAVLHVENGAMGEKL